MSPELVTIRPTELKFTFEVKQQSSCSIQLINNSEEYVAFKVKTTSPKKYCVRPNTGIILPKSTCEFTVTMQAQKTVPPEMQCKDKFLIQSMVVSFGSTEEDLTPSLFAKENGRFIQENKMRVILVSPPHSPVLVPINRALKQDSTAYDAPVIRGSLKQEPEPDEVIPKRTMMQESEIDEFPRHSRGTKEEGAAVVSLSHQEHTPVAINFSPPSSFGDKDPEEARLKASHLEKKLHDMERKLNETEKIMTRLREEKGDVIQEKELLKQELTNIKNKGSVKVQVGFPPLFVCFVALVSMYLGFLLSS